MVLNEDYLAQHSLMSLILGHGTQDPYPVYDYLRNHHPVYRDRSGIWLVSTHQYVKEVIENRDEVFPAQNPAFTQGCLSELILMQSGADHTRQRKLLAQVFSPDVMAMLRDFITGEIRRMVTPLRQQARFSLSSVAVELPVRTICKLLGIPQREAMSYLAASQGAGMLMGSLYLSNDEHARLEKEAQKFVDRLEALVDASSDDAEGAIGHWRRLEASGGISRSEFLANLVFFFVSGYVTTTLTINTVVEAALRDPAVWRAWAADPSLIPAGARELMRHDGSTHAVTRYATRDVEIGGQTIRGGDRLLLLLASANRDAQEFESPDEVDPTRSQGQHMTFGLGAHACLGRVLSKMQIETLLTTLVAAFPDATLDSATGQRTQLGRLNGHINVWIANPSAGTVTGTATSAAATAPAVPQSAAPTASARTEAATCPMSAGAGNATGSRQGCPHAAS